MAHTHGALDIMKVWFTRPSTWDLYVRGVERCHLWLQKPSFDPSPRGRARDPVLPNLPIGWRVLDPEYGDITEQVRVTVGEAIPVDQDADILNALWNTLCRSVDGRGPLEGAPAPQRWEQGLDDGSFSDADEQTITSFLFECEAPPELWFKAALLNGVEYQAAAGRWAQKYFPLDDELGVTSGEPVPVSMPAIQYDNRAARLVAG
jgi:hypothetical protein